MTSNQTRRSFGGKPLKTKTHSRSSSSTTSLQIETPSDTSPSASPSLDMPSHMNGAQAVNGIAEDIEKVEINGSRKTRRGMPLDRKQSTPMMPPFMVSAPGKVIVFGEHAVVHGKVRWKSHCSRAKLTVNSGRHCSRRFSSILPPRHCTIQIQKNHFPSIPRHQSFAYMGYRRSAMEHLLTAGKEEVLLRPRYLSRPRASRCNETASSQCFFRST